jgi:para-aminobenzoate synthetase/4-amino-4-deoxychorismate lyase
VETLRLAGGMLLGLDAHLARLAASAAYFDFPFEEKRVHTALEDAVAETPGAAVHKLRLLLDRYGAITVESSPYPEQADGMSIAVSPYRVNPDDPLLRHKTTARELYLRERERLCGSEVLDVVFVNARGELTEGAITNLWLELDGRLCTPPLASGLLPGTARARLLAERPDAGERVLYPADLARASAVYLSNALIGLLRVLPPV